MALSLQQLQKQTQRLIMTPQMQQSIQLLQLNSIELEQLTQTELLENPFLTMEEEGGEEGGEPAEDRNRVEADGDGGEADAEPPVPGVELEQLFEPDAPESLSRKEKEEPGESSSEAESSADSFGDDEPLVDPNAIENIPEQFEQVDVNWDDYYSDSESSVYSGGTYEDSEERDFSEYTPAKTSLSENLQWQLRCSSLDGVDAQIAEYLIGSLDDEGYLEAAAVQEAADLFKVELAQAERVLSILQEFDPPGIFARSLAECLLIQMKNLGSYSELARHVLEDHFVLLQKKKFREIAREVGATEPQISELFQKVCRLEPHPGRSITTDSVQYIQPDVYVKLIDGELMIYLNEGQTGRLSVDRFYQRMIRQQRAALTQKEKEYALEKYRAAITLIKNIEKRKSTILRVTEAIMEVQRPFLEKGVEALKPLTLREVADMVGMHESTIARVTSRKYAETPQGTYLLKFFFSSSIETQGNGDAVSSRSIKDRLRQLIEAEDSRKPLSDQKIAEILKADGFDIARRTVAKYREQLKILPAKYRRQS